MYSHRGRVRARVVRLAMIGLVAAWGAGSSAAPIQNGAGADRDGHAEIVTRAALTAVRFPVAHQHAMSVCYGYLYFTRDEIWFEVDSPEQDKAHAFRRRRVDLTAAEPYSIMRVPLAAEFRFRGGQKYRFWHLSRETVREAPRRPGWDMVRPYADLLQAAQSFDAVLSAAHTNVAVSAPPAMGPSARSVSFECTALSGALSQCAGKLPLDRGLGLPAGPVRVVVMSGADMFSGAITGGEPSVSLAGPGRCPLESTGAAFFYAGEHADKERPVAHASVAVSSTCR